MKMFMVTWFLVCFLVIAVLFIAYATDHLPGVPVAQHVSLETKETCSPCEENLKRLREARERWERERKAQVVDRGDTQ